MNSTEITFLNSSFVDTCNSRLERINPWCCIQIALGIITLTGAALSVAAILSYLPPVAGYVGWGTAICSLIILAIGNCCVEKRISPILPRQTDDRISGALQPAASSSKLATAQKHTQIPFQPAYVTPSKLVIPEELYALLLQYLNGKDLAAVSQVCRQWHHVASDNGLWERLCLNERICPPEGTLALPTSYQSLYSASQLWRKGLRKGMPTQREIALPAQPKNVKLQSVWKIEDYFFLHCKGSSDHYFEIWDDSLSRLICKTTLYQDYDFFDVRFKKINNIGYFFCWSRQEDDPDESILYPCDINVLRLNLKTHQPLPKMFFPQFHRAHEDFKPQFEITQNEAFIGQEDGKIVVWDLSCRKPCRDGYLNFDDQPHWTSKSEANWQASFTKKNKITLHPFPGSKMPELQMEEGEYERYYTKPSRDFHHLLQNRKSLEGHTQAITSLRIVDDYLFSSSRDGTIKQWDLKTYQCVCTIDVGFKEEVLMLNVAGHYLFGLAGEKYSSKTIAQWDLTTGERLFYKELEKNYKTFHVVGNLLILALKKDSKKTIDIYDLFSQTCLQSLTLPRLGNSETNEHSMQIVNNSLYVVGKESLHIWDFSAKD